MNTQQMLGLYYHSLEWISIFHKHKRTVLRIGYADSHANLHRLATSQLDFHLPGQSVCCHSFAMQQAIGR